MYEDDASGSRLHFSYSSEERVVDCTFQNKEYLPDVLECFQQFLRAIGYCFELNDQLVVWNEDTDSDSCKLREENLDDLFGEVQESGV